MARIIFEHIGKRYFLPRSHVFGLGNRHDTDSKRSGFASNTQAVYDFNLTIEDKEFVVLIGPSGCGKSTLLSMVAGLEEITEGNLYVDGKLINDVPPQERDMAMVFQSYALYTHMTVYDNIAFPLRMQKRPREEIDRRVKETAALLDISQYLDRKPRKLSGGERQRVAIGRAIVRHPRVLLMDEPLSNLDAKLRNQMREELIRLRGKINTTFIYVTHDQTEAMTLGDRIVVMRDGLIQQVGTPQDVFENPSNLFVGGFIGSPQMNFIDASLEESHGKYCVKIRNYKVELSPEKQERLNSEKVKSQRVIAGIRPEYISICPNENESDLIAKVEFSELMGTMTHVHIKIDSMKVVVAMPTKEIRGITQDVSIPGTTVAVEFIESGVLLFSFETGNNILYQ